MCSSPISQPLTPVTPAGLISTITVGILPPARVLAEDLTKATLNEGSSNLLKVASKYIARKATSESTSSHGADHQSEPKDNTASSSKLGALATCSRALDSNGSTAGESSQGPSELKQEVTHLTMVVSDDDEFTDDPHRIIPTEDIFTIPAIPRDDLYGFNRGYLLLTEVTAFRGIYYHESGDVRPGYTGVSPFDYPLDHQGHMASKLHSGTAAYSSYIGLISTGIVYPQQEDPNIQIDQYNYFDIIGLISPIANHGIWGCLRFLPTSIECFLGL